MSDEGFESNGSSCCGALPFASLFRTFQLAVVPPNRIVLSLAAILICYVGGRGLDRIWTGVSDRTRVVHTAGLSEIEAYATLGGRDFGAWRRRAANQYRQAAIRAVIEQTGAPDAADAEQRLTTRSLRELLQSDNAGHTTKNALDFVNERHAAAVDALRGMHAAGDLSPQQWRTRRDEVDRAADILLLALHYKNPDRFFTTAEQQTAIPILLNATPPDDAAQPSMSQADLQAAFTRAKLVRRIESERGNGPFAALLDYELHCLAATFEGLTALRLGFAGSALDSAPSMLGSLASAFRGALWIGTQRPCYAVFFGVLVFAVFSLFGTAVCRMAALHSARHEQISIGTALRFARDKYINALLVLAVPLAAFLGVGLLLILGGALTSLLSLVGLESLSALVYVLALLGGFALGLTLLGSLLAFNLMWPTLAVEGSDGFDAVSRSFSYVGQRCAHTAFYSFIVLVCGGLGFTVVRLIALLVLKLTHAATGVGMSLFGTIGSDATYTFGKLDAMWHMPAFADLTLLPSTQSAPIWGAFGHVPLSGSEAPASWLIAFWVFLIVGGLGAFLVSFFFCGSTQIYFLLRRSVDSTDFEEVYADEEPDSYLAESDRADAAPEDAPDAAGGTSLPVVTPTPPPESQPPPSTADTAGDDNAPEPSASADNDAGDDNAPKPSASADDDAADDNDSDGDDDASDSEAPSDPSPDDKTKDGD